MTTNERGQLRFPVLPPGEYVIDVELSGFSPYHEQEVANENLFLVDGTNFTCPRSGVARAEPRVDVIQEVQVQSVGVSAEYGNIQGAVFNVITRQGSNRFLYDGSYYWQTSSLTSEPVRLALPGTALQTGHERGR